MKNNALKKLLALIAALLVIVGMTVAIGEEILPAQAVEVLAEENSEKEVPAEEIPAEEVPVKEVPAEEETLPAEEVLEAVCEPLCFQEEAAEPVKPVPTESPKFYTEEAAIRWAREKGLDDFQIVKTNSGTLNVGSTVFTNREDAERYLEELRDRVIVENGGTATIANGFVITDAVEVSLNVFEQHTDAYSLNPLAAKLPVLETEFTEYVPESAKKGMAEAVANRVGVDPKKVKQHSYLEEDVSYTRFTFDKNDEHFIAEYVRDEVTRENGETRVVYRPLKVLSKKGAVYGNPFNDKIVGYAVYDISYLPVFQTVQK